MSSTATAATTTAMFDHTHHTGTNSVTVINQLPEIPASVEAKVELASRTEPITLAQITVDPEVRGGVPCIGSGRWPIALILQRLASGYTNGQIMDIYPGLTGPDIQTALEAAASVLGDPTINWSEYNLPEMLDFQQEMQAWQKLSDDALDRAENSASD